MSPLPPILFHVFSHPLPYARTLALQEHIHQLQLTLRPQSPGAHKDVLLLLQHRPVYTGGRRQSDDALADERARLRDLGADLISTQRGGQTTFHGPGQVVGYPLLDLSRWTPMMGIRDYICRMQKTIGSLLRERHGVHPGHSEHTGVFLDAHTKVASIGVQVRHRLTTHGFALNVTDEPRAWFDRVVACGLTDVRAGSIQSATGKSVLVEEEMPALVDTFGRLFERNMVPLDVENEGELGLAIKEVEAEAQQAGDWLRAPLH
jgi:lipoyl(octanoyl) transferase 2